MHVHVHVHWHFGMCIGIGMCIGMCIEMDTRRCMCILLAGGPSMGKEAVVEAALGQE